MMRTSGLMEKAKEWGLKIITIKYCRRHDKHYFGDPPPRLRQRDEACFPNGEFRIYCYATSTGEHHVAPCGDRQWQEPALPRYTPSV